MRGTRGCDAVQPVTVHDIPSHEFVGWLRQSFPRDMGAFQGGNGRGIEPHLRLNRRETPDQQVGLRLGNVAERELPSRDIQLRRTSAAENVTIAAYWRTHL